MKNDLKVWYSGSYNPNIYTTYLKYNTYLYVVGEVLSVSGYTI